MTIEDRVKQLELEVRKIRISKERHANKIKQALYERRLKGFKLGRPPVVKDTGKVLELYHRGLSYREIAQEVKLGVGTIHSIVKKHFSNRREVREWNNVRECIQLVSKLQKAGG